MYDDTHRANERDHREKRNGRKKLKIFYKSEIKHQKNDDSSTRLMKLTEWIPNLVFHSAFDSLLWILHSGSSLTLNLNKHYNFWMNATAFCTHETNQVMKSLIGGFLLPFFCYCFCSSSLFFLLLLNRIVFTAFYSFIVFLLTLQYGSDIISSETKYLHRRDEKKKRWIGSYFVCSLFAFLKLFSLKFFIWFLFKLFFSSFQHNVLWSMASDSLLSCVDASRLHISIIV